ncbi:Formylglycine-generating enzyme, required for sulfatase activity, contains SUMF1/FGE domain [Pseudidiomarina planktonica]|uniref:Formylglycine-generating enzyme, required for sulfatase activity, contains SUMF1/FGE domain n=1 Tax=Pseudidiomarina planktonica TaxID=1323738 RepID=A0A1Y6ECS9_9GAMM|nr:formylglycine-generating enzyme family protein [Pseudidiomarina planktonica]RUO66113.1 sulfatase modifying factor 1 [Pseudidiomarina planktonica]SMQ60364.1 Formylglycine-generating enzyme, required for sulfatase activity, contains SUMF1/FGE domain [Pseudidiomarina planktonica]
MMRLARLALFVTTSLALSGTVVAQEATVEEISTNISTLQSQYENFSENVAGLEAEHRNLVEQLNSLRSRSDELERARLNALEEMNNRYRQLIDDPETDISTAQKAYQQAVLAHQRNKEDIKTQVQLVAAKKEEVENVRLSRHGLINQIEILKEKRTAARVDRVQREFNKTGTIEVSQSIVCDRQETIAQCENRGKLLAKQKASKQYLDQVFSELSESETARANQEKASPNIQILGSKTVSNGFSGQGNYGVKLSVELRGQLQENQACSLLNIDLRYCNLDSDVGKDKPAGDAEAIAYDESAMYRLTLRSNVYDDEVIIDGVSYGSTPLEVMLPAGEHDVEVTKFGFESFVRRLALKESTTVRAELERAAFAFTQGEKIQDVLYRNVRGPELVVVPSGSFKMGDLSGNGLPNEKPAGTQTIESSFGISEQEITVGLFRAFVDDTSYVTEAEKGNGCSVYVDGKPQRDSKLNWREPGFTQSDTSPVVCVSYNDSQEFVSWLSSRSGFKYNLPSERQWEYAARAGTETDYWWGPNIGSGRANCRSCGSDFSNQRTAPVGTFKRNAWGLFDTVGNVWEWTYSAESGEVLVRGGSWNFAPSLARVSTRMELPKEFRSNYIGFRVVRAQR